MLSSLAYNEGYLWAMTSIQNFASLLFTLASIIFINKNKFRWSCFFLCLGLVSSAQTIIFIPIWILVLHYKGKLTWRIIIFLIIILILYFSGYQNTGIQPDFVTELFSFNKNKFLNIVTCYAPPFGSFGKRFSTVYFYFELLLLLFVSFKILVDYFKNQLTERKIVIASILVWSTAILFLAIFLRWEFESRYLIYSVLKTTCIFLYFSELFHHNLLKKLLVIFSVITYFSSCLPSVLKAKNTAVSMSALKYNVLKNGMIFFYGMVDRDARKWDPYYTDLKPNEIIPIPNRLNGVFSKHFLLFNQICNEQIKNTKFNRTISPIFNQNDSNLKLLAKNIRIDSVSSPIVYQEELFADTMFDTYFILLKSKQHTFLFNFANEIHSLNYFLISNKFKNLISIHKNHLPYGQYDMYIGRNRLKVGDFF